MNAIQMLKTDHQQIRAIFAQFDQVKAEDTNKRAALVAQLAKTLHAHAKIEEEVFYPEVQKAKAEPASQVEESRKEHDELDALADEVVNMAVTDQAFSGKWNQLKDGLLSHMREEEREMLPAAKEAISSAKMDKIGDAMADKRPS